MNKDETEVSKRDIDLIEKRLDALQRIQNSLADSAKWFYGSDDPVLIRMEQIEESVSKLTDVLVLEGKILTSLGWQTAHVQEPQS